MRLPIGFIELPLRSTDYVPVFIKASAVDSVFADKDGSRVCVPTHHNGGYPVKRTPEQVLAAIDEALRQEHQFNRGKA